MKKPATMQEAVLKWAEDHIGYKEYSGNQGFQNQVFDTMMRQVGFKNGWAWCALFAEACWSIPTYSGKSRVFVSISDNFSANAVRSFENFQNDETGLFSVIEKGIPSPGDVVIWEKRKAGAPVKNDIWTVGHAGIVQVAEPDFFKSIEGNSNDAGGREGIEVAVKKRKYNYSGKSGLCLKGFITCNV